MKLSQKAKNLWNQALECFEETSDEDNPVYRQAFLDYAHSTVREILGLKSNFNAELDRQVAQYELFEFVSFFIELNRTHNAVIYQNYLPSNDEVKNIYEKLLDFLDIIQN